MAFQGNKEPSGRFVLRVGPRLHAELQHGARDQGSSLNSYCLQLITRGRAAERDDQGPVSESRAHAAVVRDTLKVFGPAVCGIVLFGSTARGQDTAASDIDLLVVLEATVELGRDLYRQWDGRIAPHHPVTLSPHFARLPTAPTDAGSLWFEVALDAVVLWQRGSCLSRVLGSIRRAIANGELARRTTGGQPYWVRV